MESSHLQTFIDLLERSVSMKASDVHISGGIAPFYRVDAEMIALEECLLTPAVVDTMAGELMSAQQQQVFQKNQTLDIAYTTPSGTRFRVNVYRERSQTAMAIRRLDNKFRTMEELHLPSQLEELAEFPHGLVLVTGATGSGKSTTLAA